jgi:transposase
MACRKDTEILSVVHPICCGLDVHKQFVSACLLVQEPSGTIREEIKEFGTFTDQLLSLKSWLTENSCPVVAIESTGVYWHPVHNVLEGRLRVVLVNARHVKNVPGRKTDVSDSKWLAGLLRHGLLRGSFIPPRHVRQWRQLWILRTSMVQTLGDFKRRVHKHLESASIKIDSVASTLFSVTGRNLMQLLLSEQGEITREAVEQCARTGLKEKAHELCRAMQGFLTDHDRWMLSILLSMVWTIEKKIEDIDRRMECLMVDNTETLVRLDQVPGINEVAARGILSIIGPDLSVFPTEGHFCSWAGLCPGNNRTAGKRKSSRSPVQKHPLKTLLVEVAWAATKKKDSYYRDKYFRLKSRIGPKPAIYAIAHRIGKAIYHIVKEGQEFKDLGLDYLSGRNQQAKLKRLKNMAKSMGYTLAPVQVAV